MNDKQIRVALKTKYLNRFLIQPDTLVIDELGMRHGAIRADVAVLNSLFYGYEIKSDQDSLHRLPRQAETYNSIFDFITLVLSERHKREALTLVPKWWGILLANRGPRGAIWFEGIRKARQNPTRDTLAITKLMWKQEALSILEQLGLIDGLRGKPKCQAYQRLVECVPHNVLKRMVLKMLRCRKDWRTDQRRNLNDG